MEHQESLTVLRSKLLTYRHGLQLAKAKGDLDKARQWMECIVALKKEIAQCHRAPAEATPPHDVKELS